MNYIQKIKTKVHFLLKPYILSLGFCHRTKLLFFFFFFFFFLIYFKQQADLLTSTTTILTNLTQYINNLYTNFQYNTNLQYINCP